MEVAPHRFLSQISQREVYERAIFVHFRTGPPGARPLGSRWLQPADPVPEAGPVREGRPRGAEAMRRGSSPHRIGAAPPRGGSLQSCRWNRTVVVGVV